MMKKVIKYFAILLAVCSLLICAINVSEVGSGYYQDQNSELIGDGKLQNIDIQIAKLEANQKASEDLENCFFCTITLVFCILLCVKLRKA